MKEAQNRALLSTQDGTEVVVRHHYLLQCQALLIVALLNTLSSDCLVGRLSLAGIMV